MIKCFFCNEVNVEESHDVPCYLFIEQIGRNSKKNEADKLGRHYLCKEHHKEYEKCLNQFLIASAIFYSKSYFKKEDDTTTT